MTMIVVSLAAARLMSALPGWGFASPLLLFLGLLTLLNAPFDWVSLGLTRALLRRGLELGGRWPYGLALVDAGLAAVIIAALALTMVVGVQAFAALAVSGGGTAVLPLDALFSGIAEHPTAPEYWWLSALLLSTMIPSLVNLVIGGTSLVRGLPGLPSLLLRFIPAQGTAPKSTALGSPLSSPPKSPQEQPSVSPLRCSWSGSSSATSCRSSAWSCSAWPATLPPSICRRGWASSSGSACSGVPPHACVLAQADWHKELGVAQSRIPLVFEAHLFSQPSKRGTTQRPFATPDRETLNPALRSSKC